MVCRNALDLVHVPTCSEPIKYSLTPADLRLAYHALSQNAGRLRGAVNYGGGHTTPRSASVNDSVYALSEIGQHLGGVERVRLP